MKQNNSEYGHFLHIHQNIRFLGKMFSIFFYNQYNELYSNFVFIARNCSRVRLKYDFGKINGL